MNLRDFDPNAASTTDSGIFGLPFSPEQSALLFLPVEWEATTSYGGGTSGGPAAILAASRQVDLYDREVLRPYQPGLCMLPAASEVREWNAIAKEEARKVIEAGGAVGGRPELEKALETVNQLGDRLNQFVRARTRDLLGQGKWVGIVGGDHSVPYGAIEAVAERNREFGILHFDAHSDTRNAYEGFTWSHASIMYNVLTRIPQVKKLVQVGIRDFCEEESEFCRSQGDRVEVFYDADLARQRFEGGTWGRIAQDIIARLPQEVWISFDIDGLDPRLCPNTGTPVPGGLDFREATYVIATLVRSGRKIIGFDLNEVAPDSSGQSEWDANVGARLLYKLSAWMLASQGLVRPQ